MQPLFPHHERKNTVQNAHRAKLSYLSYHAGSLPKMKWSEAVRNIEADTVQ